MFWTLNHPMSRRATFGSQLDFLNRFFAAPGHLDTAPSFPAFNIWSDEDGAVVTSELPGVRMEDLDITVSGKAVTVKGSRKAEETAEKERRVRQERPSGEFERAFQLGFQIDAARVQAKLADGVLEITLPRAENDKPRKITISA